MSLIHTSQNDEREMLAVLSTEDEKFEIKVQASKTLLILYSA